jgi:hypothetical protein
MPIIKKNFDDHARIWVYVGWNFLICLTWQVQSLLEVIKDVRWDKVEAGLKTLSTRTHAVKVAKTSMQNLLNQDFILRLICISSELITAEANALDHDL